MLEQNFFWHFRDGRNVTDGKRAKIISPLIHKISDFPSVERRENQFWDSVWQKLGQKRD